MTLTSCIYTRLQQGDSLRLVLLVQYRKSFSIHQNYNQKSAVLHSLLPSSLIVDRLHVRGGATAQKSLSDLAYSHPDLVHAQ
jgi:hypothetical protein